MDAKFVLQHVPNADPSFLKILAAVAISGHVAAKIADALPVLHGLFLVKREAFHKGAWDKFHAAIEKEAEIVASLAANA